MAYRHTSNNNNSFNLFVLVTSNKSNNKQIKPISSTWHDFSLYAQNRTQHSIFNVNIPKTYDTKMLFGYFVLFNCSNDIKVIVFWLVCGWWAGELEKTLLLIQRVNSLIYYVTIDSQNNIAHTHARIGANCVYDKYALQYGCKKKICALVCMFERVYLNDWNYVSLYYK